jgi:hypothetical protein
MGDHRSHQATTARVPFVVWPTVSRPVCSGIKPHPGPKTKFLLLSDGCGFVDVGLRLWREDGSVVYNCCWSSPAQSFSALSPAGLDDHILLSQIRDSPNLEGQVPVFISPRNRVAQLYPRHWVTFSSSPKTRRATVEVFGPASTSGKKLKRFR